MRIWGFKIVGFDSLNVLGWLMFHGLDVAAVLVIPGASLLPLAPYEGPRAPSPASASATTWCR